MTHKKQHRRGENHDRWLVSYADFITLLFAFFVVLFASTQTDKNRAKAVSEAVDRALRDGALSPRVAAVLRGGAANRNDDNVLRRKPASEKPLDVRNSGDLRASMALLAKELDPEIRDQKVKLRLEERGLIIGLEEGAFFASGDDAVKPASFSILDKVARVLGKLPNPLRFEGHTDSVPINNSRFRDNWDLSAARSIAMLRLFNERFGIEVSRMAVVGYADTAATEPNTTAEGRARNRRVDIVVVSAYGMRSEARP